MIIYKRCGRTCVVCDQLKSARTHAHRTHILEVFSHAHVRPHIANVRARTHLRNSPLAKQFKLVQLIRQQMLRTYCPNIYILWPQAASAASFWLRPRHCSLQLRCFQSIQRHYLRRTMASRRRSETNMVKASMPFQSFRFFRLELLGPPREVMF